MVAKGRCDDAGADHDPAGASPNGAHPGEGIGSVSARVTPWLEMIADKNRVESDLLRKAGKLQQFGGRKLFSRRLVTNLQHKHSISSRACRHQPTINECWQSTFHQQFSARDYPREDACAPATTL